MSQKSLLQFFKRPSENSDSSPSNEPVNEDFDDDMTVNEENNEVDQINLSNEETEQQDQNSTKNPVALNRQYGFKRIWLKKFPWLKVASFDEKKVYCDFCKSEKVDTIWSSSKKLPTWRIDAFNYHEQKDKDHAKAVAAMKTRPLNAIKTAAKVAQQKDGEAVIRIIRKVLFVVQHNLPISTSTDLHTFVRYLGETSSNPNIIVNSHKSNFLTYQFLKAIDASLFQAIITRLRESICFTLHVDESTDITEQKHLMLYATLWNAGNCSTETTFLAILRIKQADSKSLCQKITEFFVGNGVNLKKMTGFTSDGASVMLGVKKGVAQRLKNDEGIAHLIDSHCVAHKEALAMKDVLNEKESSYFWSIEQKTKELVGFLALQTTRNELEELCKALEETYIAPKRIFDIRWLPRFDVVKSLTRMALPILMYLKSKDSTHYPQLKGLRKRICNFKYQLSMFHLCDVLEPIHKLCLKFQSNVVHPFDVPGMVETALSLLHDRYLGTNFIKGPMATKFMADVEENVNKIVTDELLKPGTVSDDNRLAVEREVITLVELLSNRMRHRLITDNSKLLKAFRIFVPPNESSETLSAEERIAFGRNDVKVLQETYRTVLELDDSEIYNEWEDLKRFSLFPLAGKPNCEEEWWNVCSICAHRTDTYPNLSKLCCVLLSMNVQNAIVERGFSLAHRIKTKARARLHVKVLDSLMRVKLTSPPYDQMDLSDSYKIWIEMSERGRYNIGLPAKKIRRKETSQNSQNDSEESDLDDERASEFLNCLT